MVSKYKLKNRTRKPYKKIKKPVKKTKFQRRIENGVFQKVVESRKSLETVVEPKTMGSLEERVGTEEEVKPEPVEKIEPVRILVKNIPEHETFISRMIKKLKSIFRKKESWSTNF